MGSVAAALGCTGPETGWFWVERELRASDGDRQAVVERLERALVEGRLTVAEFDERTGHAHAALTCAELAELTTDLPASIW